jgi:hypothetical protein
MTNQPRSSQELTERFCGMSIFSSPQQRTGRDASLDVHVLVSVLLFAGAPTIVVNPASPFVTQAVFVQILSISSAQPVPAAAPPKISLSVHKRAPAASQKSWAASCDTFSEHLPPSLLAPHTPLSFAGHLSSLHASRLTRGRGPADVTRTGDTSSSPRYTDILASKCLLLDRGPRGTST